MRELPPIHLCIVQPSGYMHSLGLLDQARYFRFQLRRVGATVTCAKNRLRADAVNLVLGAHLGFDPALMRRHSCIFVNLEQLGAGGAQVSPDYLRLLRHAAVVDYDAANVAAYAADADDVPLVPLLHAPYLAPDAPIPLEERTIDLLFIGSMNERRRAWIDRIEACGRSVSVLDSPLYGAERDALIRNARGLLNVHFYESSRFEQARVSHALSLGTPVISERTDATRPHEAFEDCVLWVQDAAEAEQLFGEDFGTPAYYEAVRGALERFRAADPIEAYADLAAFCVGFFKAERTRVDTGPWRPTLINLGSGKDYQPGWLNLDVLDRAQPDLLLDLARPLELPFAAALEGGGVVVLEEGGIDVINANNVLEHVPDLTALMGNCLRLLRTGGDLRIEVPCEGSPTAWQDPTHVRAMNENSWIYYTQWFWYLGWYEHRFEMGESTFLDLQLAPCERKSAAFMRLTLRKVETTARERMVARTMQTDLRLPEDEVPPELMYGAVDPLPPAVAHEPDAPASAWPRVPQARDERASRAA
jgi:SAM-dependent methyltransferase